MAVVNAASKAPNFDPNERQREAIEHVQGPLMVVAGAGTGKTSVLIRRIARLIREGHARPDEILAITYADNAAAEIQHRVQQEMTGTNIRGLRGKTFHAYCNELLQRCGRNFAVLDDQDLRIFLRRRLPELRLKYFVRAANVSKFLDDLLDFMGRCHDELVGPEDYADYVRRLERKEVPIQRVARSRDHDAMGEDEILERCNEIASVFAIVERMLAENNYGTFSHMITHAHQLLQQDAQVLATERAASRFLLVDEFQDVNFAQVKILLLLAGSERNVFAVGDPDQAIYRFRGASSAAFELFARHFPRSQMVVLDKNQRSTPAILQAAFALIKNNPSAVATVWGNGTPYTRSPLQSARAEAAASRGQSLPSPPVEIVAVKERDVEAFDLVETIKTQKTRLKCPWSDFAVLYRSHQHRDEVVAELVDRNIPFSIENMDVMDTAEVRDALACLSAIAFPEDSAGLFRVTAFPRFGMDPEPLRDALRTLSREERQSGLAAILPGIPGGPAVLEALRETREEIAARGGKCSTALQILMRRMGFNRSSRPLMALVNFVERWEKRPLTATSGISEFLEYLEDFREAKGSIALPAEERDAVRLMTAHAAKGMEFKHVFVIRAGSGSFPTSFRESLVEFPSSLLNKDSIAPGDSKQLHEQEELRLFYVAATRARDTLTFTAKPGTGKDKTPPGLLRTLFKTAGLGGVVRMREARPFQVEIFGEAQARPAASASRAGEWLTLPPAFPLHTRLSASALATYKSCPLQFKLEREWGFARENSAAMRYGGAIHLVLRAFFESVRYGRTMSDDDLFALFRSSLRDAAIEDAYQHDLYLKQGLEQLRQFLASARDQAPNVKHTEESFELQIGDTTIRGRIDRVDSLGDGKYAIVDYKTGKPKSQDDSDDSLQLSIYAIAAKEKWGYQVDKLVFHNLEDNTAVATSRSDVDLENTKAEVRDVARKIANGVFTPNKQFHCRFCPYNNLCPATEVRMFSGVSSDAGLPGESGEKQ